MGASRFSSPSFGSDAAGSASDDTINVWQVSVVPCAVPGAYLGEQKQYNSITLKQNKFNVVIMSVEKPSLYQTHRPHSDVIRPLVRGNRGRLQTNPKGMHVLYKIIKSTGDVNG